MRYQPKTQEELNPVYPKGEYQFEVHAAAEKTSKKGEEMIEVNLRVYAPSGKSFFVKDWLSGAEWGEARFNQFCHCVGIQERYFAGSVDAADLPGLSGTVKIKIDDKDPQYGEQNRVAGYVVPKVATGETAKASAVSSLPGTPNNKVQAQDDDVPF